MTMIAPSELVVRTLRRRAVEAAVWGMPIVSVEAMREAYFRDAGAAYNDILYWSKPSDWRFQFTTPNASTHYVYFNINTKDGPVVVDVPASDRCGLFGSLVDAWQFPVTDVGPQGRDAGRGGRYLLLPPGYQRNIPEGCFALPMHTYNGYALLRAIPRSHAAADIAEALDLVKALRVYPLAAVQKPPAQRFIDMASRPLEGAVTFDESFYSRLARMVEEEPVQPRDLAAMGQLRSLGIGEGLTFRPSPATRAILSEAADEAHQLFMQGTRTGERFWPLAHWIISAQVGPKTGFNYVLPDRLEIDERSVVFFLAFAAPAKLGSATFYLGAWRDSEGELLRGDRTYRLPVPPDVPVKQYWAVTAYDSATACFLRGMPRAGVDSYDAQLRRNPDGSVDLYAGPVPPAGQETNWIPTAEDREWFAFFRFYGPERSLFSRAWTLGDFQRVA